MEKKTLLFNFSNSNSVVRIFLLHAVYLTIIRRARVGSYSKAHEAKG